VFDVDQLKDRLDLLQQRIPPVAFAVGVWLRYREDRNYEYAALLSYYGFFSLFPLLMVLVTVLGWLLRDNQELLARILDSTFSQIPVVGTELARDVTALEGNGISLVIALLVTLWAGLGVVKVAQDAFNNMWGMSIMRRPGFFPKLLRSVGSLLVIGGGFVLATVVSGISFATDLPGLSAVAGAAAAMLVNSLVALATFKVLTASEVSFRQLLPGALTGGFALWVLQLVGNFYIQGVVIGAGAIYGSFATVIGLLVWMSLVARVLLLAAEVNVVTHRRLWPRAFEGRNLTEADMRAFDEVSRRDIRRQPNARPVTAGPKTSTEIEGEEGEAGQGGLPATND
jgi:YihY family inner membrane protein